jgi:hypothetical protein
MFSRISSKNYSNSAPVYAPTQACPLDLATHDVTVLYPAGATGVIAIPASGVDVDGTRFNIHLAGRLKLFSGATAGTFALWINNGLSGAASLQSLLKLNVTSLPASQSGTIYPFFASITGVYDAQSGLITFVSSYRIGNATLLGHQDPATATSTVAIESSQLQFFLNYQFGTVAPLAGTTLEITEFFV